MMVNRTKHESNDCREAIENEMDFFPVTFELPDQWHMFVEEFKVTDFYRYFRLKISTSGFQKNLSVKMAETKRKRNRFG